MTTEAHKAALACELGQLSLYDSYCDVMGCATEKPRIQISSSDCHIEKALWPVEHLPDNDWSKDILFGMGFSLPCDESNDKAVDRLFFAAGRAHLNVTQGHDIPNIWEGALQPADNMTLWVCKPRNIFGPVDAVISPHGVVHSITQRSVNDSISPSTEPFPGITDWTMAERFLDTMNGSLLQQEDTLEDLE